MPARAEPRWWFGAAHKLALGEEPPFRVSQPGPVDGAPWEWAWRDPGGFGGWVYVCVCV